MKKNYLFFLLLLCSICVFGQNRGDGATNWGAALPMPCFSNLYVSVRSVGYEPSVSKYGYNWRIENRSSKRVSFTIKPWIIAADGKYKELMLDGLFTLDPGQTYTHTTSYNKVSPRGCSTEIFIMNYSEDKNGPVYNCVSGTKVCVANCNGSGSGTGSSSMSGTAAVKPNVAEVILQGSRQVYKCRAVIDDVQCPGGLRLSISPDDLDAKKLVVYNMPKEASGNFTLSGSGDACALKILISWFDNNKFRYVSASGTITKTGANSFTLNLSLPGGETVTGSGNYTMP